MTPTPGRRGGRTQEDGVTTDEAIDAIRAALPKHRSIERSDLDRPRPDYANRALATLINAVLDGSLVKAAEARGWNNGMLAAASHVAEARNSHAPGPIFKALNEALGKIDDARFTTLRAEVPK